MKILHPKWLAVHPQRGRSWPVMTMSATAWCTCRRTDCVTLQQARKELMVLYEVLIKFRGCYVRLRVRVILLWGLIRVMGYTLMTGRKLLVRWVGHACAVQVSCLPSPEQWLTSYVPRPPKK